MASAPTSRLSFLDVSGGSIDAPQEWARGYIAVDVPLLRWQDVELRRNGEPLEIYIRELAQRARVVADWPLSGTGHYHLELSDGDVREERRLSVWPRKITPANYFQLLDDLERLPPAIAVALQHQGALAGIKLPPPEQATLSGELLRLRRAISGTDSRPGLAQVLRSLAAEHYSVLRTSEIFLPRERVRRIHPTRLAQAFAVAHRLDADGFPPRLPEMQVEHTSDVYENRLVRAFHDQVSLRVRRLQARLERTELHSVRDELAELNRSLGAARRAATFLDDVSSPRQLPTQLTMVLLRRPAYRAALEGFIEYRRTVSIRLEEPALDAPLENLPTLYETWGTLHVLNALVEIADELGWKVEERIFQRDASGLFLHVLRGGRAALIARDLTTKTTAKVLVQRTYGRKGRPLRSASFEQRPDVAIEIEARGQAARVLIFDPKYKLESEQLEGEITDGRPKKVDIDKMHAYRDAIRNERDGRPVEFAAIIYPGASSETFGPGLGALAARPGEDTHFETGLRRILIHALSFSASDRATAA
jgi:hypothetical protein